MALERAGQPIERAYFPRSGVGSTVVQGGNGRQIEVGLFGCDGMSGIASILQSRYAINDTFIQIEGDGLAIDADRLADLLGQSASLRRHLSRYVLAMMAQMAQTALSNAHSKLEERLAGWLLMCHDRSGNDNLALTHEFVALMLGVRRAGVTVGTHVLEGEGLIEAKRGRITILDRAGLEKRARDTYGAAEAEYARLIGFRGARQRAALAKTDP
ncbi:Crp/Fnr family transcriptional regulator [Roseovarius spongiae]|uniref:Crp/Fnr family transcriptional regulator n=2 Tax=Roseovarius spongiae TaxID=2320272 RepID=A0A3A8ARZ9_9RHOB|nr:Crp/Fnr family transcriptional regulator [Roseovarius spongiae]